MYCIVFENTVLICMDCIVLTMMFMLFLSVCSVFYDKFHVQLLQDLWNEICLCMYILQRNTIPSEENLAHSLLCFIGQTHEICPIQLWKIIHYACFHPLNHNHDTKQDFMCHSFQFVYGPVSMHDRSHELQGRNHTSSQPNANTHPNMYISGWKCL